VVDGTVRADEKVHPPQSGSGQQNLFRAIASAVGSYVVSQVQQVSTTASGNCADVVMVGSDMVLSWFVRWESRPRPAFTSPVRGRLASAAGEVKVDRERSRRSHCGRGLLDPGRTGCPVWTGSGALTCDNRTRWTQCYASALKEFQKVGLAVRS